MQNNIAEHFKSPIGGDDYYPILWWRQGRYVLPGVFEVHTYPDCRGFYLAQERRIVMLDKGYAYIWEHKEVRLIPEERAVEHRVTRKGFSRFPVNGRPGPNRDETPQWFINRMEQITNALIMRS